SGIGSDQTVSLDFHGRAWKHEPRSGTANGWMTLRYLSRTLGRRHRCRSRTLHVLRSVRWSETVPEFIEAANGFGSFFWSTLGRQRGVVRFWWDLGNNLASFFRVLL